MTSSRTMRACVLTGAFAAGITAAVGPGFAGAAVDKVQSVFVTNGDDAPVPTKAIGTTKVDASGQTLTINGVVDAAGSKVDASGSTITIQGDPSGAPVPVEVTKQPTGTKTEPYQDFVVVERNAAFPAIGQERFVDVAADERLTITNFSTSTTDPLQTLSISERCDAGGDPASGFGGENFAELGPSHAGAIQAINQNTTFELSPGACGFVSARWESGSTSIVVTVTGYTTKLSSPQVRSFERSDADVAAAALADARKRAR